MNDQHTRGYQGESKDMSTIPKPKSKFSYTFLDEVGILEHANLGETYTVESEAQGEFQKNSTIFL